jgi:uncharacterized protein (DUF427 family)
LLTLLIGGGAVYASPSPEPLQRTGEPQPRFSDQPVQTAISPKWVRVTFGGEVIADSRRVMLVWVQGRTPVYYFPEQDVRMNVMTRTNHHTRNENLGEASYYSLKVGSKAGENAAWHYPERADLKGHVAFNWDMMDGWYEEGEEVFVHARDPYKRVDVLQSSRKVRVVLGGMTVAESSRPVLLFETGLPTRYYLPKADVRFDLLRPSDTITRCPYKGEARYYSVEIGGQLFKDVVWYYRYPTTECSKIANHLAFYNERVDAMFGDGVEIPKPQRGQG